MKREWKPGDVALRTGQDGSTCFSLAIRADRDRIYCSREGHPSEIHWHHDSGGWNPIDDPPRFGNYRPLVVIDPEDREQVERLHQSILRVYGQQKITDAADNATLMQAALREFANPTPPKPEEPTGLGAVVEDAAGRKWVRTEWRYPWTVTYDEESGESNNYADIDVVRVVSKGLTA